MHNKINVWGYTEILPTEKQLAISSKLDNSATTV